jgi:hypothetical protein
MPVLLPLPCTKTFLSIVCPVVGNSISMDLAVPDVAKECG